jgi:hypothetical protein
VCERERDKERKREGERDIEREKENKKYFNSPMTSAVLFLTLT